MLDCAPAIHIPGIGSKIPHSGLSRCWARLSPHRITTFTNTPDIVQGIAPRLITKEAQTAQITERINNPPVPEPRNPNRPPARQTAIVASKNPSSRPASRPVSQPVSRPISRPASRPVSCVPSQALSGNVTPNRSTGSPNLDRTFALALERLEQRQASNPASPVASTSTLPKAEEKAEVKEEPERETINLNTPHPHPHRPHPHPSIPQVDLPLPR